MVVKDQGEHLFLFSDDEGVIFFAFQISGLGKSTF